MGKDDNSSSAFGTVFWTILWGAVGYLTYGTVQGAVVLIAASILMGISAVLGLIPIVGVWGTWAVNNYIRTWLLSYVTLTWGIQVIFWLNMLVSAFVSALVILTIISSD